MPKILVVDDDLAVLTTIGMGLRKAGYRVLQVDSGQLALSVCKHEKPDLAILDMVMPGIHGLELAQLLKTHTSTPFIFLSAHGDEALVKAAIAAGALGYLVKPMEISHIVPAIEEALKRSDESLHLRPGNANLDEAAFASTIDRAVNCIMERHHLPRAEAFELLRENARHHSGGIESLSILLLSDADVRLVQ